MTDAETTLDYLRLVGALSWKITSDDSFRPDTIVGLSAGGFRVAADLSKLLSVPSKDVVGMPVQKFDDGHYRLYEELVTMDKCYGRAVLVVDDTSNRGLLLREVKNILTDRGALVRTCTLVSNANGLQPDYTANKVDSGTLPKFGPQHPIGYVPGEPHP